MRFILIIVILGLQGCVVAGPREYRFAIDFRNTTGRPVSVEILRIESGRIGKTRCDLADGGYFTTAFTTFNSAEYLEARLRFLDGPDAAPRHITELPKGEVKADIITLDNRLALQERPQSAPKPR